MHAQAAVFATFDDYPAQVVYSIASAGGPMALNGTRAHIYIFMSVGGGLSACVASVELCAIAPVRGSLLGREAVFSG